MKKLLGYPESLSKVQTKYCGGCGHGIIHRVITRSEERRVGKECIP
jgi:2-oxoglutarate ferredoxin oxidoreductase subunit beta